MFIKVDATGIARLEDQDNFRAFKVVCTAPRDACGDALAQVGRVDGDHVWVARAWLDQHGRIDEAWRAGLQKMLDYAASSGWVDERGAVRAHIDIAAA
jgi:hypothetical protein